jgi:hypothetical protein
MFSLTFGLFEAFYDFLLSQSFERNNSMIFHGYDLIWAKIAQINKPHLQA